MPRIFVAGSRGEEGIVLRGKEAHYLRDVLRMKKGEKITIFDKEEGDGCIDDIARDHVDIVIKKWENIQRGIGISITLAQSILKGEKMDMVLEKAAEIGVDSIIPLVTERVIPRKSRGEKRRRWERIVCEAARLCGRTVAPKISPPVTLSDFSKRELQGLRILPWEGEKGFALLSLLREKEKANGAIVVMGPEGGFSEGEVNILREAGFRTVSLGPFILRSDTATIYTLSCIVGWRLCKP